MKDTILSDREKFLLRHIRNFIVHQHRNPSIRFLMRQMNYKSTRSVSILISNLKEKGILSKDSFGNLNINENCYNESYNERTIDVPLIGNIHCGTPLLAEESIEKTIPVSTKLAKPPYKYFFLKAIGDSMNQKGIDDGDLVLIKQQNVAKNGDLVVALIDDSATIKEIKILDNVILLIPRSSNPDHKEIVLSRDFLIQGIVVTSIKL